MEECRDAEAHLMVLKGQLPYTDPMCWFYGPFAFCIYPLIFKIFGVNLVVFRLSYVIIASFVIPCVYYLARRLMPSMWAGLAAFLATLLIGVPYYTYNHILATIAGLLALLFIVRFIEHFDNIRNLFFAGIFVGITLLVKPFFMGFGILFSIILFILFLKFKKAAFIKIKLIHVIMLFFGLLTILTPFLLYFAIHKNLYKFLMHIMPIGLNRASGFYAYSATLTSLREHWELLKTIMPYKIL